MPEPALVVVPVLAGDEPEARKHADRLAAAVGAEAAFFFAGSSLVVACEAFPPAWERDEGAARELLALRGATMLGPAGLAQHRARFLGGAGPADGRALLLRATLTEGSGEDVVAALRASEDLPEGVGWAVFEAAGDVFVVLRPGPASMETALSAAISGDIGRTLERATTFDPALPATSLFPELVHVDDGLRSVTPA